MNGLGAGAGGPARVHPKLLASLERANLHTALKTALEAVNAVIGGASLHLNTIKAHYPNPFDTLKATSKLAKQTATLAEKSVQAALTAAETVATTAKALGVPAPLIAAYSEIVDTLTETLTAARQTAVESTNAEDAILNNDPAPNQEALAQNTLDNAEQSLAALQLVPDLLKNAEQIRMKVQYEIRKEAAANKPNNTEMTGGKRRRYSRKTKTSKKSKKTRGRR
jgi:hypothetical protein